ncbi:MAG: hypothetical protein WD669_01525 [Pirellulales bacterium]
MAGEDDDDLYDEEFDFVDDDESELDDESSLVDEGPADEADSDGRGRELDEPADEEPVDEEPVDEYGRPEPAANYVVHVYEYKKFKRTIDRPFTPEDAEAFATEFNRTGKSYGRVAVSGKNDAKPKKALD